MFKAIKNYFAKRRVAKGKREKEWMDYHSRAFKGIQFPILIFQLNTYYYLNDLTDYAFDFDLYHYRFHQEEFIVDSAGNVHYWKYDDEKEANVPDNINSIIGIDELKRLLEHKRLFLSSSKNEDEDYLAAQSFAEIFEVLKSNYRKTLY